MEVRMKNILLVTLLLIGIAFACSKKIDLNNNVLVHTLINIDDTGLSYELNDNPWKTPIKQFLENGHRFFYYSESDSNTLIYLTFVKADSTKSALFAFRICHDNDECDSLEKEHPVIDIIDYEIHRILLEGVYHTTEKEADSLAEHVVGKLRDFGNLGHKIYSNTVYNVQCGDYAFNDTVVYGSICVDRPEGFFREIDSCNALLDAQPIKEIRPLPLKRVDVGIHGREIIVNSPDKTSNVVIFSLMGKTLERHRVSGANASITTKVPAGQYILQVKNRNGSAIQKVIVK